MSEKQQQEILLNYRIAYLADTKVNWCPALGTVLANDEVSEGVSIRGDILLNNGSMRIRCFACFGLCPAFVGWIGNH